MKTVCTVIFTVVYVRSHAVEHKTGFVSPDLQALQLQIHLQNNTFCTFICKIIHFADVFSSET